MSTSASAIRAVATATTLAAAGIMTLDAAPRAFAAPMTFVVDTLSDNPADGLTLREAVDDANNNAGLDTIEFADGVTGTITLTGGQLESTDDLAIVGPGADDLVIDANDMSRIIESTTPGVSLTLDGLTITGGAVLGSGGGVAFTGDELAVRRTTFIDNQASNQGGALWVTNPTNSLISITDSRFETNRSGNAGGGLYLVDGAGNGEFRVAGNTFMDNESVNGNGGGGFISAPNRDVFVAASEVADNNASNGNAGGMWIDGARTHVTGVEFRANYAGSSFGGATINSNTGSVFVTESTFLSNASPKGGAGNISSGLDLTVTDTTFDTNTSPAIGGVELSANGDVIVDTSRFVDNFGGLTGAARVTSAVTLEIIDSTFSNNTGVDHGALAVIAAPTTITGSTFDGNKADAVIGLGGAAYVSGAADMTVHNSTFHANEAADGGAIYGMGGSDITLVHTTMTDNIASGEAGGLYITAGADGVIDRSIVDNNMAPTFPDVNDAMLDLNKSILGDGSGIAVNGSGFLIGIDPELQPLADNGGPTLTRMPAIGSPAIGGAADAVIPLDYVDQRGRERGFDADMGSVEVGTGDDQIWVPTAPARFVDTRANGETIDGANQATGAFGNLEERQVTFAGRGDVPADAVAVIANVTAVNPIATSFLSAHPCINPTPLVSSLNFTPGVNLGNEIILGLNAGDACFFTPFPIDLTVDVVGYIPASSPYTAIEPARYADTRAAGVTFDGDYLGDGAPGAGQQYAVKIGNRGSVPDDAVAAVMYVAAVKPDANGFVTVWDCDGDAPLASSLNHVAGVNRGNEIIAEIGTGDDDDMVCFFTSANVDVSVDVVGFIPAGSNFDAAESPSRLLDTRPGETTVDGMSAGEGVVGAGETIELTVAGRAGVPQLATTVAINVTAVNPSAPGFVTVYDCDVLPLASSLNYTPGVNGGNEIIASVNDDGKLCLFTSAATHLTADVTGWTSL